MKGICIKIIPAITGIILLMGSCEKEERVDCYDKNLRSIEFGFESSIEKWITKGGSGERKFDSDIQISNEIPGNSKHSVKFTVSPDSYINSGNRAELTFDQQVEEGDETFYEYSLFIPHNYPDVNSMKDSEGIPNWQIMGQWHDQPDVCMDETWETHESRSPPIAVYYNYLLKTDPAFTDLLSDQETHKMHGVDTTWNEISTISLMYYNKLIAISDISNGKWLRLKFHIKWSTNNDGFIQAWINNHEWTNNKVYGRNMLNKASHYFKFGLYRNPSIPFTQIVYYDDIRIF